MRQSYNKLELIVLRGRVRRGYTGPGMQNQVVDGDGSGDFYFPGWLVGKELEPLPDTQPPPIVWLPREQTPEEREVNDLLDEIDDQGGIGAMGAAPKPGFLGGVLVNLHTFLEDLQLKMIG